VDAERIVVSPCTISRLMAIRVVAPLLAALTLGGCAVTIDRPADQSTSITTSVPVRIGLPFAYVADSFKARLNEADITEQFTVDTAQKLATATLTLQPGTYRLDARACWAFNILFVMQPPWPTSGCPTATSAFQVVQPRLVLSPAQVTTTVGATTSVSLHADPAPMAPLVVALTPPSVVSSPSTVTIPAGSTANVTINLQGTSPGTGAFGATANGWLGATSQVQVSPQLTSLSPTSGPPGTLLTLQGKGFVGATQVHFGTQATISASPSANGTLIQLPVPATLSPGTPLVTVVSNLQASTGINFTVTPPPPVDPVLFRATDERVEVIRFTPAAVFANSSFTLLSSLPVTPSPGTLAVGLALKGMQLARTSANDLQLFNIGGTAATPTLTLAAGTTTATGLSGSGTATAFMPTFLVRATDTGIETISLTGTPLSKLGSINGGSSTHGVALLVDSASQRAWRSMDTGLEVYDLSNPAAPNRVANVVTNMSTSTTGTAMDWVTPGARLVRATNVGIDVVNTSTLPPTRLGFNNTGGASSMGVGMAVTGTRAVRATSFGIEVWDISTPASPRQCSFRSGDLSGTGVDVQVIGTVAIRATNISIEAYDISDMSCPTPASGTIIPAPVPFRTLLDQSSTGVALLQKK